MVVEPFFGIPELREENKIDLFMLMPFSNDLLPVYEDHIKKVVTKMSLVIKRADNFFTTHHIIQV